MTALRRRWQRSTAVVATGAAAFIGTAIAATPAQAHSKDWSVDCYAVSVNLTNYSSEHDNALTISAGGKELTSTSFKGEFHKKIDLPKHSKELPVTVKVKAGDDDKFSWDDTKTSPVCEESPSPSPSESESGSPSPSASPSTSASPSQSASEAPAPGASEPSSSAPAAKPQTGGGEDLAETGSSSNTPMIAGIAAAVVVLGGALVAFARKRRSS